MGLRIAKGSDIRVFALANVREIYGRIQAAVANYIPVPDLFGEQLPLALAILRIMGS